MAQGKEIKRQTNINKILFRQIKIEQQERTKNSGNSGAREHYVFPAPLVLDTSICK